MRKPSNQQVDREELARNAAVEAVRSRDASPRIDEESMHGEDAPMTMDTESRPMVPTPPPPQTPVGEHGKLCFNPQVSCLLRN